MVGPWFATPWLPVSQSHGAVAWRFRSPIPSHVPFSLATSRHQPNPSVPWFPYTMGLLCGPSHTPILAPGPIPSLIPCSYPTGPPATQWRGTTGSSSIRGPFCAPCTGRSNSIPFYRVLVASSSACSYPGHLATCLKSWPHWPTCVLAREHSVSRRLWPRRDATTRSPNRAWRGRVFCVLYACTACGLAVLDLVFQTSHGRMPFSCLSLATHVRGSFFLLFLPIPGSGVLL